MKLLQDYASVLSGLLKDQRLQEGNAYRLMHFVVQQPVEEGVLLYNVLTRAVVLLSPEEARKMEENPASTPELVAKWFAVPMDHDDRLLAQEVRAVGKMLENPVRSIKGFTILTTTDCNARCFYCYEKGRRRIPMLEETALKVADFILKNHANDSVKLRWFGGEPLYNKGVISLICGKLKEAGVEYKSSMVSNGYLFDDATVDEAVRLWNLKKVQITLDGTEKVYNRSKAFIYPEGSAYRRVLGNIHRLLDAGIRVTVRLNIDRHNADDLFALVDILTAEFGGQKLFGSDGNPCNVDAALSRLVNASPIGQSLLAGSSASGSGASASSQNGWTGQKTMKRSQFDMLDAAAKMKTVQSGTRIVD